MFVDEVDIEVVSGKGGNGCISFRREKYVPRGGPDGGDGGRGGDVVFRAAQDVVSLFHLANQKIWKAKNGQQGGSAQMHGASAEPLIIDVPVGTMIFDRNHEILLKDLKNTGDSITVVRGGFGGKGNIRFKTATNRAPRIADPGGPGESRQLHLELRMIADVGLVGKPNAGKSTLLSRVSRARPAIDSYPFTTTNPHLGLVQVGDSRGFVMADIPGLIEGAHRGAGLGHDFLRHIQRAGIILHLVEPLPADGTDPIENYKTIRHELQEFDPELCERAEIIAVTKADLPESKELAARFQAELGKTPIVISAVTGEGLNQLTNCICGHLKPKASW